MNARKGIHILYMYTRMNITYTQDGGYSSNTRRVGGGAFLVVVANYCYFVIGRHLPSCTLPTHVYLQYSYYIRIETYNTLLYTLCTDARMYLCYNKRTYVYYYRRRLRRTAPWA